MKSVAELITAERARQAAKVQPRQKWEYRVEHAKCGGMGTNALNALGADRWELCATIATPDTPSDLSSAWPAVVIYIFKRPA